MGRRKDNKTSPRAIATAEKQAEALEYRKRGYSYSQIGAALDPPLTAQRAHQLVDGALKAIIAEPGESVVALELARLDDLLTAVMEAAIKGDLFAIDRVLKIGERRARMLGSDAPDKTELTGKDGAPLPSVGITFVGIEPQRAEGALPES